MTASPSDRRAHAIAVRQDRLARVAAIRRRAVASALALFVAIWLLIAMLLVTGHDPALARTKTRTASRSAETPSPARNGGTSTTRATSTTQATSTTASPTTARASAATASNASPSALTSSQS